MIRAAWKNRTTLHTSKSLLANKKKKKNLPPMVLGMMQKLSSSSSLADESSSLVTTFAVHSTYRHKKTGEPLRPVGLQWNLPGTSHVTFVELDSTKDSVTETPDTDERTKAGIVHAYNRWAFAREEPFVTIDDIDRVDRHGRHHVTVQWKNDTIDQRLFHEQCHTDMAALLQQDPAAQAGAKIPAQVWINGQYAGLLQGPDSLPPMQQALSRVASRRLAYKRSSNDNDCHMIRIERYFGGYLRQKDEIFDHILDNLIAMEDVEQLDERTLIGTATLCDWIMGGTLTSRLWVQQQDDRIRFMRPLRNDDISTSDRKFDLKRGKDDDKIAMVENELARLHQLATLSHPFVAPSSVEKDPLEEVRRRLAENRPRRNFFGM